jgi:hypothetical protein
MIWWKNKDVINQIYNLFKRCHLLFVIYILTIGCADFSNVTANNINYQNELPKKLEIEFIYL